MPSYEKFFQDVRESVKERLSGFNLTDQKLDAFLKQEEQQIRDEYENLDGPECEGMTQDDGYKAAVESVSMCLEYCY